MSKEISVREVLQAGGVVRHDIEVARQEREFGAVTMESLVKARKQAKVGSRPVRGGGPFVSAGESRGVI